jgi:FkbM family methyltransferase
MKRIITNLLGAMGYQLLKIQTLKPSVETMENALQSLAKKHQINTIIDVGASDGIWSRLALNFYPQSQYLLIEANPAHEQALKAFVLEYGNTQYILAAAGDRQGGQVSFSFDSEDLYGGQASYVPQTSSITIPQTTIDNEIQSRKLRGPYLIKLDTHGFEIPIFKGALQTLMDTEVIIVECYNFKISPECLLFYEMCEYLDQLGFRCIDLADPLWRPFDQAFWQMDLVFIRKERPEFSYTSYR